MDLLTFLRSDTMYYTIVDVFPAIPIERMGNYWIKYDDYVFYSVWYDKHCLLENTTLASAREFCSARINQRCEIVFVLNTYFVYIRGQVFSKYVDQERWYRRPYRPWIGFYPIPEKVRFGSLLYISLAQDCIEAEKAGKISLFYKPYYNENDRCIFNKI